MSTGRILRMCRARPQELQTRDPRWSLWNLILLWYVDPVWYHTTRISANSVPSRSAVQRKIRSSTTTEEQREVLRTTHEEIMLLLDKDDVCMLVARRWAATVWLFAAAAPEGELCPDDGVTPLDGVVGALDGLKILSHTLMLGRERMLVLREEAAQSVETAGSVLQAITAPIPRPVTTE